MIIFKKREMNTEEEKIIPHRQGSITLYGDEDEITYDSFSSLTRLL